MEHLRRYFFLMFSEWGYKRVVRERCEQKLVPPPSVIWGGVSATSHRA